MNLYLKRKSSKEISGKRNRYQIRAHLHLSLGILIADATVRFRAQYSLKTPDVIQLVSADICGAELILTTGSAWTKTEISGIALIDELVG